MAFISLGRERLPCAWSLPSDCLLPSIMTRLSKSRARESFHSAGCVCTPKARRRSSPVSSCLSGNCPVEAPIEAQRRVVFCLPRVGMMICDKLRVHQKRRDPTPTRGHPELLFRRKQWRLTIVNPSTLRWRQEDQEEDLQLCVKFKAHLGCVKPRLIS